MRLLESIANFPPQNVWDWLILIAVLGFYAIVLVWAAITIYKFVVKQQNKKKQKEQENKEVIDVKEENKGENNDENI